MTSKRRRVLREVTDDQGGRWFVVEPTSEQRQELAQRRLQAKMRADEVERKVAHELVAAVDADAESFESAELKRALTSVSQRAKPPAKPKQPPRWRNVEDAHAELEWAERVARDAERDLNAHRNAGLDTRDREAQLERAQQRVRRVREQYSRELGWEVDEHTGELRPFTGSRRESEPEYVPEPVHREFQNRGGGVAIECDLESCWRCGKGY